MNWGIMDKLLSIREAADLLGVHPRTLRRWISAGRLPATLIPGRFGGEYRIAAKDLEQIKLHEPPARPVAKWRRCAAIARDGTPCRAAARQGSDFCRHHQPAAED